MRSTFEDCAATAEPDWIIAK
ncbi:hypothetical protein IL54_0087 [Sphingobium sp. ba1]|nr:hypothetical protein IL54_0087 [Sphingobium sp. ba1]